MSNVISYENQIDGNPSQIRSHSRYYQGIAEAVAETIANLKTVTSTLDTVSDAVAAFAEIATEVATSLDEVDDRYLTMAEQLAYYADQLEDLQSQSSHVQELARQTHSSYLTQSAARDHAMQDMWSIDPQSPQAAEAANDYQYRAQRADELAADLAAYERQLDQLLDDWRAIADACASRINDVIDGSSLNDSWWDSFANWVETVLPDIETFLDILSIVLTVAAFLAVLTGVGAALAPALFAIARGIQLLSKAIAVVKLVTTVVQVARGKKSPMALLQLGLDFAIDKIGGDVIKGVSSRVGNNVMSQVADRVLDGASGNATLRGNLALIQADGFDNWVAQTLTPALNTPGTSNAAEGLLVRGGQLAESGADFIGNGLNAVKTGFGAVALSPQTMVNLEGISMHLDMFNGPSNVLSGLGNDTFNLAKGFAEDGFNIDLSVGSFVFPDSPLTDRPSYERVMASSS